MGAANLNGCSKLEWVQQTLAHRDKKGCHDMLTDPAASHDCLEPKWSARANLLLYSLL